MGEYSEPGAGLDGRGMRIGVVAGRFNDHVTKPLLEGALVTLDGCGVAPSDVAVHWVPGAFEVPLVARRLAGSGTVDAVVCLGAVIRGDTAHFDYVAGPCAYGVARAALDTGVPVIFGVLTTDNVEQALERSQPDASNKGAEGAATALEMVDLLRQLPKGAR